MTMERYEYIGQAGSGAYGQVWVCRVRPLPDGEEATDKLQPGMLVACKVFRQAHTDKEIMRLALREVRVLKALSHKNCVRLLDAFKSKTGKVYLIFEYVPGCAYTELCKHRQGLPQQSLKLLALQMCLGLRYLHREKIVHRDLKPSNILIDNDGVVKICDFGFARFTSCSDPRDAEALSTYVVTRWYRAPEVLLGLEYGPAADIWALGCTIAELAVGEPLMPGTSTIDQLWRIMRIFGPLPPRMASRLSDDPRLAPLRPPPPGRPLATRLAHIGPRLLQFLEACLRPEPAERLTADELLRFPYFFEVPQLIAGTPLEPLVTRELSTRPPPRGKPPPPPAAAAAAAATPPPPSKHHTFVSGCDDGRLEPVGVVSYPAPAAAGATAAAGQGRQGAAATAVVTATAAVAAAAPRVAAVAAAAPRVAAVAAAAPRVAGPLPAEMVGIAALAGQPLQQQQPLHGSQQQQQRGGDAGGQQQDKLDAAAAAAETIASASDAGATAGDSGTGTGLEGFGSLYPDPTFASAGALPRVGGGGGGGAQLQSVSCPATPDNGCGNPPRPPSQRARQPHLNQLSSDTSTGDDGGGQVAAVGAKCATTEPAALTGSGSAVGAVAGGGTSTSCSGSAATAGVWSGAPPATRAWDQSNPPSLSPRSPLAASAVTAARAAGHPPPTPPVGLQLSDGHAVKTQQQQQQQQDIKEREKQNGGQQQQQGLQGGSDPPSLQYGIGIHGVGAAAADPFAHASHCTEVSFGPTVPKAGPSRLSRLLQQAVAAVAAASGSSASGPMAALSGGTNPIAATASGGGGGSVSARIGTTGGSMGGGSASFRAAAAAAFAAAEAQDVAAPGGNPGSAATCQGHPSLHSWANGEGVTVEQLRDCLALAEMLSEAAKAGAVHATAATNSRPNSLRPSVTPPSAGASGGGVLVDLHAARVLQNAGEVACVEAETWLQTRHNSGGSAAAAPLRAVDLRPAVMPERELPPPAQPPLQPPLQPPHASSGAAAVAESEPWVPLGQLPRQRTMRLMHAIAGGNGSSADAAVVHPGPMHAAVSGRGPPPDRRLGGALESATSAPRPGTGIHIGVGPGWTPRAVVVNIAHSVPVLSPRTTTTSLPPGPVGGGASPLPEISKVLMQSQTSSFGAMSMMMLAGELEEVMTPMGAPQLASCTGMVYPHRRPPGPPANGAVYDLTTSPFTSGAWSPYGPVVAAAAAAAGMQPQSVPRHREVPKPLRGDLSGEHYLLNTAASINITTRIGFPWEGPGGGGGRPAAAAGFPLSAGALTSGGAAAGVTAALRNGSGGVAVASSGFGAADAEVRCLKPQGDVAAAAISSSGNQGGGAGWVSRFGRESTAERSLQDSARGCRTAAAATAAEAAVAGVDCGGGGGAGASHKGSMPFSRHQQSSSGQSATAATAEPAAAVGAPLSQDVAQSESCGRDRGPGSFAAASCDAAAAATIATIAAPHGGCRSTAPGVTPTTPRPDDAALPHSGSVPVPSATQQSWRVGAINRGGSEASDGGVSGGGDSVRRVSGRERLDRSEPHSTTRGSFLQRDTSRQDAVEAYAAAGAARLGSCRPAETAEAVTGSGRSGDSSGGIKQSRAAKLLQKARRKLQKLFS